MRLSPIAYSLIPDDIVFLGQVQKVGPNINTVTMLADSTLNISKFRQGQIDHRNGGKPTSGCSWKQSLHHWKDMTLAHEHGQNKIPPACVPTSSYFTPYWSSQNEMPSCSGKVDTTFRDQKGIGKTSENRCRLNLII